MIEIKVERPPRTAMEVFNLLPEGTLCEVIQNQLYMAPPPNEFHQRTLTDLFLEIGMFIKQHNLGETRVAPYAVYLHDENVVEPDLLFISKENKHMIRKNGLHGAPDLIIEILSPSNEKHDTVLKKRLYEKSGVKEYWIVDPETREAKGYELINSNYSELQKAIGKISSKLLGQIFSF